jgi:hypothetical protein
LHGRKVEVEFVHAIDGTKLIKTFAAEYKTSAEQQKQVGLVF